MTNSTGILINLKNKTKQKEQPKFTNLSGCVPKPDTAQKPTEMLLEKTGQIYITHKNSPYTPTSHFNLNSDQTYEASFCLCYHLVSLFP